MTIFLSICFSASAANKQYGWNPLTGRRDAVRTIEWLNANINTNGYWNRVSDGIMINSDGTGDILWQSREDGIRIIY